MALPTIVVTYEAKFTTGSDLATQLAQMGFMPLDQGETEPGGMPIIPGGDVTTWAPPYLTRTVTFQETPESVERMGVPVTDEKRIALVKGLFLNKISVKIRKPVKESIVIVP